MTRDVHVELENVRPAASPPASHAHESPVAVDEADVIAGRYALTRSLGAGTYGKVYLANDLELEREVAVKVLRPDYASSETSVQRFLAEARFAAKVSPHPNIVTVFDLLRTDDLLCIVLEYVEGDDLRTQLGNGCALSLSRSAEIMDGILSGLAAAHRREIIHRDVKPANVLIDTAGRVKLTDFGIAQALRASRGPDEDGVPGTAAYMAPEQIRNEQVREQTDLYAAGVILFEMVTGRRLFNARTRAEVAVKHLRQRVPSPRSLNPDISEAVERVMLRALEKDWRHRYGSADEMNAELRAACDPRSAAPRLQPAPSPAPPAPAVPRVETDDSGTVMFTPSALLVPVTDDHRYESLLRALGAYLDQEPSDRITVLEVSDGFLLRKQRSLNTWTEIVMVHLTGEMLRAQAAQLRRERPRRRRVRHPGLWASFPQGHQDFFRALGYELDAAHARAVVIDEGEESLVVTYRHADASDTRVTVLGRSEIEQIINAAFERRKKPTTRFDLDAASASAAADGTPS